MFIFSSRILSFSFLSADDVAVFALVSAFTLACSSNCNLFSVSSLSIISRTSGAISAFGFFFKAALAFLTLSFCCFSKSFLASASSFSLCFSAAFCSFSASLVLFLLSALFLFASSLSVISVSISTVACEGTNSVS